MTSSPKPDIRGTSRALLARAYPMAYSAWTFQSAQQEAESINTVGGEQCDAHSGFLVPYEFTLYEF